MMEDSLARALAGLRGVRMDDVASDAVRSKLEAAWAERSVRNHRRTGFFVPAFARAIAVAILVVAVGLTTLHSSADSPLYAARVAIENSLVAFQSDPVAYLSQLYDERMEEAARFEATGNALAASRARDAQSDALRLLNQLVPQPEQSPEPSASTVISVPSPSPTPETAAATSPSPDPTATSSPTVARTPTPRPATVAPTPTPKITPKPTIIPRPSPTPTSTPMTVHATGDVLYADGSRVDGACVSMTFDGSTCVAVTTNGRIELTLTARKGQTITLYVRNHYDPSSAGTLRGKVTVTVGGTEVLLGTITLR